MRFNKLIIIVFICAAWVLSSCAMTPKYQTILNEKDKELKDITAAFRKQVEETDKLAAEKKTLENSLGASEKTIDIERAAAVEITENMNLSLKQVALLKEELISVQKQLTAEKNARGESEKKAENFENRLNQSLETIELLNTEARAKISKIEELEKIGGAQKNQIADLQKQLELKNNEIQVFNNRFELLQKNADERLAVEINARQTAEKKIDELKIEIKQIEDKQLNLKTANDSLQTNIDNMRAYFTEKEKEYKNALELAQIEFTNLQNRLESVKIEGNDSFAFELNKLKEEIARLNIIAKNSALVENEYSKLKNEYSELLTFVGADKLEKLKTVKIENKKIADALADTAFDYEINIENEYVNIVIYDKNIFETNKIELKKSSRQLLQKIAEVINLYENRNIIVEGHTDNEPVNSQRFPSNWELAAARAGLVARTLTRNFNVDKERITIQAFASSKPKADNATAEGRAMNRRVEINIIAQ